MSANTNTYPYWYPPPVQRPNSLAGQDTERRDRNVIPGQDLYRQDDIRVAPKVVVYQDSRRAGNADKEALAVGQPGYLYQRVLSSPVLNPGKAE